MKVRSGSGRGDGEEKRMWVLAQQGVASKPRHSAQVETKSVDENVHVPAHRRSIRKVPTDAKTWGRFSVA